MLTIALPIAGLSAAGVLIQTVLPTGEEAASATMGTADLGVYADPSLDVTALTRLLPAGSVFATTENLEEARVVRGEQIFIRVRETSVGIESPPLRGVYAVRSGRAPRSAGEAIVHPKVLELYDVRVGERLSVAGIDMRVTGTAVMRGSLDEIVILAAQGTLAGRKGLAKEVYIDLPAPADVRAVQRQLSLHSTFSREEVIRSGLSDRMRANAAAFGLAAAALLGTGLIAAAAFAVGARRQLRSLGILGAIGGEAKHVRATVLLGGVTTGLTASVAGSALGIAVVAALRPRLDEMVGRVVGPLDVSALVVAGSIALGTVAATLAAFAPARAVARVGTVAALAGRFPKPHPSGRLARRGVVLIAAGVVMIASGTVRRRGLTLAGGFVATLVGFLMAVPLAVSAIGRFAPRLSPALRVAARDTARHGRRTGAAVAAATLAMTFPIAVAALSLSTESVVGHASPLAPDQMLVSFGDSDPAITEPLRDNLRRLFPGASIATLRVGIARQKSPSVASGSKNAVPDPWTVFVEAGQVRAGANAVTRAVGELFIGDDELVRAMAGESALRAFARGEVVAVGVPVEAGAVALLLGTDATGEPKRVRIPAAPVATETGDGSVPRFLISEPAARKLGIDAGLPVGLVVRATRPLTEDDALSARRLSETYPSMFVQTADDVTPDTAAGLRATAIAVSVVCALAIVAVAIALVGSESRRDQAILVAIGAGPRLRRKVAAARAGLLTLSSAMLAIPAGFIPVAVVQSARAAEYPIVIPWTALFVVGVVTPLLAAAAAAAASRAPRPMAMLRPIA